MSLVSIENHSANKRLKEYKKRVDRSSGFIKGHIGEDTPHFAITLGSGLQDLVSAMDISESIPYNKIPGFPKCTADGHEGKLIIGKIEEVPIMGFQGRIHFYENAFKSNFSAMQDAVYAVNVAAGIGISNFLSTNAGGAVNKSYSSGDFMVITTHNGLFLGSNNPLLFMNHMDFQTVHNRDKHYFLPTSKAYDKELSDMLHLSGVAAGAKMRKGVYAWVSGPNYETDGDIAALRSMGVDAVGMSVVPECLTALHRGMDFVAMTCITNDSNKTSHEEVKKILNNPETKTKAANILKNFFRAYRTEYVLF